MAVRKIISGGQTGADQGALDAAISCDFPYGGAIPAGRITENGPLPQSYHLEELVSPHYPERTERNVRDGDGTLILSRGPLTGGSALTMRLAAKHGKPWLHLDLSCITMTEGVGRVKSWLTAQRIEVLNVAGPRASNDPEIYGLTRAVIEAVLEEGQ